MCQKSQLLLRKIDACQYTSQEIHMYVFASVYQILSYALYHMKQCNCKLHQQLKDLPTMQSNTRAAIRLKIVIAINHAIKIFNRDYSRLIVPKQETQVCGTE